LKISIIQYGKITITLFETAYSLNPYSRTENIPDEYSQSSSVLNVDTFSLSDESQGLYSGYVVQGTKLVGQTSNAVAYVSNRRLISDVNGILIGSFFLRDPNTDPAPLVRINTGTKTFKVSSSSTNSEPVPGDTTISSAKTTYTSEGTLELYEKWSKLDLPWHAIQVGLVDERFVDPTDENSNELLINTHLLKNKAANASFLGMVFSNS